MSLKLVVLPSHNVRTPAQPVLALMPSSQAPGKASHRSTSFEVRGRTRPDKGKLSSSPTFPASGVYRVWLDSLLYFCICTCSAQLSMFHMERRSRNTLIINVIIIIIVCVRDRFLLLLLLLLAFFLTNHRGSHIPSS